MESFPRPRDEGRHQSAYYKAILIIIYISRKPNELWLLLAIFVWDLGSSWTWTSPERNYNLPKGNKNKKFSWMGVLLGAKKNICNSKAFGSQMDVLWNSFL